MLDWTSWLGTLVAILIALAAAAAIIVVTGLIASAVSRKLPWVKDLDRRIRRALAALSLVVALWIACAITSPVREEWWPGLSRIFLVATILLGAWLIAALVSFGFERLMLQEEKGITGAERRKRRTQVIVIHRLILIFIGVAAVGAALFTFPELRVVGTSLLASAGIVSVIAGLAAQSIFGNLIAGIQIAFTDAIRVGDVVVVEGEWGTIGEINLSYVVVYIWDERRLIVPCSYFTTNPIETWTRKSDKILGTVYMDLDWRVPMDAVRERFQQVMEDAPAWDRRASSAVVTDARGGFVTVRFVVSAKDSSDQWDLCCHVREQMMSWLQQKHPDALPRTRIHMDPGAPADSDQTAKSLVE
jgi:small-conductance mechanosensitive channel